MDSLIKLLTTIGIIAAVGFVGYQHFDSCADQKDIKDEITALASELGEDIDLNCTTSKYANKLSEDWKKSANWDKTKSCDEILEEQLEDLKKMKKEKEDKEEEIAKERIEKMTFRYKIPHDGEPDGTVPVTLDASKSTPTENGDDMTWNWVSTDGKVEIEDQGAKEISFDAKAGQYKFQLTLTDSYGASSSEARIVDVAGEDNTAPKIIIEKK